MTCRTSEIRLDHGDLSAPQGSPAWAKAVHFEAIGALNDAATSREHLDVWIKAIRETGAYRHMQDEQGRPFLLWEVYCTTRQPIGLGYSPDEIDAILSERQSAAAIDAKDEASQRPRGRPQKNVDNIHIYERPAGTSAQQALRRLRKDRPDLHARVVSGQLSANAAMIEAGFRKRPIQVQRTADGAIRVFNALEDPEKQIVVKRVMDWIDEFCAEGLAPLDAAP